MDIFHLLLEAAASSSDDPLKGLLSLASSSKSLYSMFKASEATFMRTVLATLTLHSPDKLSEVLSLANDQHGRLSALEPRPPDSTPPLATARLFLLRTAISIASRLLQLAQFLHALRRIEKTLGFEHPNEPAPSLANWLDAVYHYVQHGIYCGCQDHLPDHAGSAFYWRVDWIVARLKADAVLLEPAELVASNFLRTVQAVDAVVRDAENWRLLGELVGAWGPLEQRWSGAAETDVERLEDRDIAERLWAEFERWWSERAEKRVAVECAWARADYPVPWLALELD